MSEPIHVAIVAVIERRAGCAQLLVSRRRRDTVLPDFWELPGGKVERDETPQGCAVREAREELGVTVVIDRALPVIEHTYDHGCVRLHPFIAARVDGEPTNIEVADHRWVDRDELNCLHFPPANAALMKQLADHLALMDHNGNTTRP